MSNRTRPQVSFNLNNKLDKTLYDKIMELDSNFSNAAKYIFFAYFFPAGGNQDQSQKTASNNITDQPEEEEQFEGLEGLPMF